MITTEDIFFHAMEAISTIQQAAFRGSKDAAKQLSSLAFHATSSLESLDADWTASLSPDFAPLSARKAMIQELFWVQTNWPIMCRIEKDGGKVDWLRIHLEAALTVLGYKFPGFAEFSIKRKTNELTQYLFPILLGGKREGLEALAVSIVTKNDNKKITRKRKIIAELRKENYRTVIQETKIVHIEKEIAEIAKAERKPTEAEMREALKADVESRLKTMSPKTKSSK